MFDNIRIILTTRGRIDFQPTLDNLVNEIKEHVTIVCHPGEKGQHGLNWGDKVKEVIEHLKEFNHLGEIRKWCLEFFREDYIILLDDNLNFHVRREGELGESCKFPLHQLINKHFTDETICDVQLNMFKWLINNLKSYKYGIIGVSQRSGNNRMVNEEYENKRFFAFWGVNKYYYNLIGPELFKQFPNKNDFCLGLEFLTFGIPNIVSYKYAFDKVGGANNKGGCSVYRNVEMSNKEAFDLQKLFPEFVKVREKSVKSWGGDFKDKAYDVTIQWKKAYEYGLKLLEE